MKKTVIGLLIFIMFILFCGNVSAQEIENEHTYGKDINESIYSSLYDAAGIEQTEKEIDEKTAEYLEKWGLFPSSQTSTEGLEPGSFISAVISYFAAAIKNPFTALLAAVSAVIICSVSKSLSSGTMSETADYFAALCISASVIIPLMATVNRASEVITSCGNFMLCFVPVFSGILICSGRTATAAGYTPAVFIAAQSASFLGTKIVTPFCGMMSGLVVASSLSPQKGFDSVVKTIKKSASWILGIGMTLYAGAVAVTGAINASSDSMSLRTARYLTGSTVPVIGGVLSEVMSTMSGSMKLLSTGVGGYGVAAVFLILLPVFCELLLWKLSLAICSITAGIFSVDSAERLFDSICSVISILIAVVLSCAALFLASMTVIFIAGSGVQ